MKNLLKSLFLTAIAALTACSDVAENIEPAGDGSARTAELRFNCDIESFDVQTRAATASWDDGAKVYIQFLGNSRVSGYATYKKSTGVWTVYLDDAITQGQTSTCEVYYFENPASSSSSNVTLSAESAVYADKAATYLYRNGVVTLQGHLKPQTGRVRFRGTAGYTFMLKGLKWYSVYNASSGSLTLTSGQMGLTIGSNGYTQYVYATYDNSSTRQLTVSSASQGSYDKSFGSSVLAAGKSGYINVPTLDNRYGWTLTGTNLESLYCPDSNHPHAIDLGLGVKFACCNVGADSPTDYGNYYAWGETSTKIQYDWSTYKWCNGTQNSMTKYCTKSSYGTVDDKTTLELSDDAARVNWGGSWRMPTYSELKKLNTDCTWTWTTVNNINGYRVTGSNGNSIFLPAAGYRNDTSLDMAGYWGCYWSSSSGTGNGYSAINLRFTSDGGHGLALGDGRDYGESVRPVYDESSGNRITITANGVSFNMIKVEGGTFQMGSTSGDDNERPVHQVTLTNDYYIGETEVTQELWTAVMGSNPSSFKSSNQLPVEFVSWDDCQTFITMLNALTGRTFRLPTEAEWEFAARGGNASEGYTYSGSNNVGDVAWYNSNSSSRTHVVATKAPNELGIYDMSGNVWEWCQDWFGIYSSEAQTNPTGPTSGSVRVARGCSWGEGGSTCRVTNRYWNSASPALSLLGLRLAL